MPDRLESELRALAVEWPPTPDLAGAVEAAIAAPAPPRRRRRLARLQPAWIAAAIALVIAAGLAVSPDARSALLDLLGLRGAKVERRAIPPHPAPHPGRLGSGLHLGRAVTLDEARRRVGFPLTLPSSLGTPDAAWLDQPAGQPVRVSLVYGRRPGIPVSPHTNVAVLLTQFRAQVTPVMQKMLGAGARVEQIDLPGARAFLIVGTPHGFAWLDDRGNAWFDERRLAGQTLLVERDDGVLLRAEGELGAARARELARALAQR